MSNKLRMKMNRIGNLLCITGFLVGWNCVGPPDPEHGLVENFPVVINTANTFSFILRGEDYSFEEDYALNLNVETLDTLLTTIVVSDFSGNDTTLIIQINQDSSSILETYSISSNNFFLIKDTVIDTVYSSLSDSIFFTGNKFTGVLEFILSKIGP
jgi:hypothetical protein